MSGSRTHRLWLIVCASWLTWLPGCGEEPWPATEIMLVVDTDWPDLHHVQIELRGFGDGRPVYIAMGERPLPRTLGLIHDGGPLGPFDLVVRAYRERDSEPVLVEPRSDIFFVENETKTLRVDLRFACNGACSEDQACIVDDSSVAQCIAGADAVKLGTWEGAERLGGLPTVAVSEPVASDGGPVARDEETDPAPPKSDAGQGMVAPPTTAVMPPVCGPDCAPTDTMEHTESVGCDAGACKMTCQDGWGDCDGRMDNGCEADLTTYCGICAGIPGKRKTLTIDGEAVKKDLNDFVVLVALDDPELMDATDSGLDICFTADDGVTTLPFEIDTWDRSNAALRAWVKLPTLTAAQATTVQLYYGDGREADRSDQAGVWSPDHIAVWHLGDAEESAAGLSGEVHLAVPSEGYLGGGFAFDGDGGYIEFDQDRLDNVFPGGATVEAWINPDTWGEDDFGRIVAKAATTDSASGWSLYMRDDSSARSTLCFAYDELGFIPDVWAGTNDALSLDTWQHVAVSYDPLEDAVPRMYVDGQEIPVVTVTEAGLLPNDDSDHPLRIGNHSHGGGRAFDGVIDELRISRGAREPAWFATEFANQTRDSTFVTAGPAQPVP